MCLLLSPPPPPRPVWTCLRWTASPGAWPTATRGLPRAPTTFGAAALTGGWVGEALRCAAQCLGLRRGGTRAPTWEARHAHAEDAPCRSTLLTRPTLPPSSHWLRPPPAAIRQAARCARRQVGGGRRFSDAAAGPGKERQGARHADQGCCKLGKSRSALGLHLAHRAYRSPPTAARPAGRRAPARLARRPVPAAALCRGAGRRPRAAPPRPARAAVLPGPGCLAGGAAVPRRGGGGGGRGGFGGACCARRRG